MWTNKAENMNFEVTMNQERISVRKVPLQLMGEERQTYIFTMLGSKKLERRNCTHQNVRYERGSGLQYGIKFQECKGDKNRKNLTKIRYKLERQAVGHSVLQSLLRNRMRREVNYWTENEEM